MPSNTIQIPHHRCILVMYTHTYISMQLLNPSNSVATPADTATKAKLSYRKHLLAKAQTNATANKSTNTALMPRSIAKKQLDATSPTTVNPLI